MSRPVVFFCLALLLAFSLACQAVGSVVDVLQPKSDVPSEKALTEVARYVAAGMTMTAQVAAPAPTEPPPTQPPPTLPPSPAPTQAPPTPATSLEESPTAALVAKLPTPTETLPAQATASACRYEAYLDDENIPSGKEMPVNHKFTKTWRIRNTGNCDWTPDFSLACMSGCDLFGAPYSVPLTARGVPVKGSTEVRVEMRAPKNSKLIGKLSTSTWMIRGGGKLFGIQPDGKTPLSVTVKTTD